MTGAIHVRQSTDQQGVAAKQRWVTRQVEHATACAACGDQVNRRKGDSGRQARLRCEQG